MSNLKECFLTTLVAMILAAGCGTFAGYRQASYMTVRTTEDQLEHYASRLMADGETSSIEIRAVLASMGASRHNACSNEEIDYFRTLIFNSKYLKDAGRMRDGKIECSAILGRQANPRVQPEPDFTRLDGMHFYKSLTPYRKNDQMVIALEQGGSYVVFTPAVRMQREPELMHYTVTVTDAPTQKSGQLIGELPPSGGPIFTRDGVVQMGGSLYATRCSSRLFTCFTAYASMLEAKQANSVKIIGYVALFRILGGLTGLGLSLLYYRYKSVERQFRRAIRSDKLYLVYQPIVNPSTRQIVGAEALARWTTEKGVAVSPDVFIKIAEEQGIVGSLTRLVVRHALRDFGEILRSQNGFRLSINVAAADLSDPKFLPMLNGSLDEAAIPAPSVCIEITEGATVMREAAITTIQSLHERGHSVHIDDFGTGYSSLSYLHDLSVDAIKIDRAFTKTIGTGAAISAILPQILAMADALDLRVIAEGVETEEQARYFAEADEHILAQGWLFGRPVPADKFMLLLADEEKKKETLVEVI
jgi:sensor c-di-GMP phosphodiesterase-like protein